jgi:hypothetical protein
MHGRATPEAGTPATAAEASMPDPGRSTSRSTAPRTPSWTVTQPTIRCRHTTPREKFEPNAKTQRTCLQQSGGNSGSSTATEATEARQTVETLLEFLTDPRAVYRRVAGADRRPLSPLRVSSLYLDRDHHGIRTTHAEPGAVAAPLIATIRPRNASGGDLPEQITAIENGFHKPMGSATKPDVREGGLEPPRPKTQEPKSCASASSATRADEPPYRTSGRRSFKAAGERPGTSVSHTCALPYAGVDDSRRQPRRR